MKKTKKTLGEKCLKSFKHYPLVNANKEEKESRKDKYLITTINFSFANQDKNDIDYDKNKPSPNFKEVHKNEYIMNLKQLFDFHETLDGVCEEIIKIEQIIV
jgi:hypothetical protein